MNKKKISMAAIIGIFIVVICAFTYNATPARKIAKQLNLGYKFLQEGEWEQAIVAFNNVIEIDANMEEAYIGAADAYVKLGDMEGAIDILRKGASNTKGDNVISKISGVYGVYADALISDGKWIEATDLLKNGYEEFPTEVILQKLEIVCFEYAEKLVLENEWEESIAYLEDIYKFTSDKKILDKIEELKAQYAAYLMQLKAEDLLNSPNREKRIEYIASAFNGSADINYFFLTDGIIKKHEDLYNGYLEELTIYRNNIDVLTDEEKKDLYSALIWYYARIDLSACNEVVSEAKVNGIENVFPNKNGMEFDKYGRVVTEKDNFYKRTYRYEDTLLIEVQDQLFANGAVDLAINYLYHYDENSILTDITSTYSKNPNSINGYAFETELHFNYVDDYMIITMMQHYDNGDFPFCVKAKFDEFSRITEEYMGETENQLSLKTSLEYATIDEFCAGAKYRKK